MKRLLPLALLLLTTPVMAQDYSQPGGTQQTACYETVYREEYVPGTKNNPGYVRRYNERVEKPCPGGQQTTRQQSRDDNSCVEGTVIGGLLGGGIGGLISRGDGRWVAVPTGAVAGALLGCQVDGG